MTAEESSLPRGVARCGKRGSVMPATAARCSSSQSPDCCWRAQGDGWSDISNSTRVRRAARTGSVDGLHRHAGFNLTNARSGIHALADIHYANAAHAHRIFVLLVAEGRNGNSVEPGSIEDGRSRRNRHWYAVNGELNLGRRPWNSCHPLAGSRHPPGSGDGRGVRRPPRENASGQTRWAREPPARGRRSKSASGHA